MKKLNLRVLLCAVLLLGLALLNNSCKRYSEICSQPLTTKQDILKAQNYVDSIVLQQGSNAFVKKMGFEILWAKAIVDSANNIRVPIFFNLNKLKLKDGKQTVNSKIKDIFELYIKKDKEQTEVSIMQFMHIKGKYYPLRFTLTGEMKTKLMGGISMQNAEMPKGGGGKVSSLSPNAMMMYESEFVGLIQSMYGPNVMAVVVSECRFGTSFNPETCQCDFTENVTGGGFYPELFMHLINSSGSYELVPYPFSFHPSSIVPDPTHPGGPIGGGGGSGGSGGSGGDGDGGGSGNEGGDSFNFGTPVSLDDYSENSIVFSNDTARARKVLWAFCDGTTFQLKSREIMTQVKWATGGGWQFAGLSHDSHYAEGYVIGGTVDIEDFRWNSINYVSKVTAYVEWRTKVSLTVAGIPSTKYGKPDESSKSWNSWGLPD